MRGVQTIAGLAAAAAVLGMGAVLWARPTPVAEGDACESPAARAFVKATAADPAALWSANLLVVRYEAGPGPWTLKTELSNQAKLELRMRFHKEATALSFCRRAWVSRPSGRVVSIPSIAAVLTPYVGSEAEAWALARCTVETGKSLSADPAATVERLRARCSRRVAAS